MRMFQDLSIRRKQTLIMLLTSSVALLLACVTFIAYDTVTFRRELSQRVTILADAIGNNCVAAIDFNDPKAASETLGALRADNDIVSACVYSRDGQAFAVYQRDADAAFAPPAKRAEGLEFTGVELHLFRTIKQDGVPTGTIYVTSDLKDLSSRLMRYVEIVGAVFLVSSLAALLLSSRLQRLVSDPVLQLAQVARTVAQEKNYSVRAIKQSNDELGQLVAGFNEMLAQIQQRDAALQAARDNLETRVEQRTQELESTHKQLVEASRLGGMAEIATNVLHNIGNVLNSVNVSATLVADGVKKSKAASLVKVAALLHEHEQDLEAFLTGDPRGKQLPAYLSQLATHFLDEQKATLKELGLLRDNIDHIKEIVAMQQSYARVSAIKEIINLNELAEDSLRMDEGALNRHRVEVVREFETIPPMNVEKHKVLQILVNLVRNAKHACQESERADRRLTMRTTSEGGRVKLSVMDNGVGIPPENLTRIFNHGFTTKKNGHGFGLHSGALAAIEMGGSLTVHSGGSGLGATFILELPGGLPEQGSPAIGKNSAA